jgi:hypothetical protein
VPVSTNSNVVGIQHEFRVMNLYIKQLTFSLQQCIVMMLVDLYCKIKPEECLDAQIGMLGWAPFVVTAGSSSVRSVNFD